MPVMNFDLQDGKVPVSLNVNQEDCERMMAFMAECTTYKDSAEQLQHEVRSLKHKMAFDDDGFGWVSVEQYADAVNTLFKIAVQDTGGSVAAAQVLLGLYNSSAFHADLVDIACRFDAPYRRAAVIAILGRGQLREEPHTVIENGDERFRRLWNQWEDLRVDKRYAKHYRG